MSLLISEGHCGTPNTCGKADGRLALEPTSVVLDGKCWLSWLGAGNRQPSPFDPLGACTVMTVKLYAQRKSIPVTHVQVMTAHHRDPDSQRDVFARSIFIDGTMDDAQMAQLLAAADRCPVSRTLCKGSDITTTRSPTAIATARRVDDETHVRAMDHACGEPGAG